MNNYKIIIEYNGSNYSGWQSQHNATSIQKEVEKAILAFSGEKVSIFGAGRTDSGVHSLGQCATFKLNKKNDTYKILHGVNFHLSTENIKIISVNEVAESFHARYNAKKKIYFYNIFNRPVPSAIHYPYSLHVNKPLDISLLKDASRYLLGTHDFSCFRAHGCQAKSPIKTIDRIEILMKEELVIFEFEAKSFLYQQIRIMVGSLIEIGLKRKPIIWIKELIEKKDRKLAGQTALSKGLFLKEIQY